MPDPAPAPNTAAPPAPEIKEVDFDGIKLSLPKDQADALIAARQRMKDEHRNLAGKMGEIEAARKAAEAQAKREAEDKEAIRLAKDGEIGKVREMMTAEHAQKINALTRTLARQSVVAAVARAVPQLDAAAQNDISDLVLAKARPSVDDPTALEFLDSDGKPIQKDGKPATLDGYLADFLAARKHFVPATAPPPGPRGTKPTDTPAGASMSRESFQALSPREQSKFINGGGTILKS